MNALALKALASILLCANGVSLSGILFSDSSTVLPVAALLLSFGTALGAFFTMRRQSRVDYSQQMGQRIDELEKERDDYKQERDDYKKGLAECGRARHEAEERIVRLLIRLEERGAL